MSRFNAFLFLLLWFLIFIHFSLKSILTIFILLSLLTLGCGEQNGKTADVETTTQKTKNQIKLDSSEYYQADVSLAMTLAEVSKVNGLSETYLKQKLGIPQYIKHPYTVLEFSRNYKFTVDDLKRIIEKHKNTRTLEIKKSLERNKEINE